MTESRLPSTDSLQLPLVVLRCQAGDEEAFARLFEWFGPRTLAYLRGLVGEDAEDVQQEVWLGVYRQVAGLADVRAFRTWLYRLTRHRAIDQLRRQRRARELFVEDQDVEAVVDPASSMEDRREPIAPDRLLAQLPVLQREVVVLRYRDELSYAEIAAIVGCSVGTVRSRLFYARQRLAAVAGAGVPDEDLRDVHQGGAK